MLTGSVELLLLFQPPAEPPKKVRCQVTRCGWEETSGTSRNNPWEHRFQNQLRVVWMRLTTRLHLEENGTPGFEAGAVADEVARVDPSSQCPALASAQSESAFKQE